MPVFSYKGRNPNGDLMQGKLEGSDSGDVANQLFNLGISPIEIKASGGVKTAATRGASFWKSLNKRKISHLDVMLFSRQMNTLLKSGVPIMRALAGLQESSHNPSFTEVLQDLRESLDSGRELSAALRRHPKVFSLFYVSMVQVGEMTGTLDETFSRLYAHLEFEKMMNETIKTAVRYPMFVVIAMTAAVVIVNLFVIPSFVKVFESFHSELPLVTRMLIGFSNFTVHFWPLLLGLIIAAAFGFRYYINTPEGRFNWDKMKFKIPIAGKIIFKGSLARFARSLALSFKSGIPIVQGLTVVSMVVDNEYMRTQVENMRDGVERGESILRTAVASGVFNSTVLQMIAVGEETGDMDGLMFEVAGMYEREVEYEVKSLSSQIEPIMIVALGIMVLILALGIFMPMWDLGKASLHR